MKKALILFAIGCLSFQTGHAQWWSGSKEVDGNGRMTSQNRNVSEYDQVSLTGSMDVELIPGREGNLKVAAEENLLEYIVTEVKGSRLHISVQEGYNLDPSRNNQIVITVPFETLDEVSLTGSGDISSSREIQAENFQIKITGSGDVSLPLVASNVRARITGSGDISLRGKAKNFDCTVTGSGDISAFEFKCETVDATVTGSGDLQVYASRELKAKTPGSGDIVYKGNPQKEYFKSMGSGDITKY